jgi:hypothetical protein
MLLKIFPAGAVMPPQFRGRVEQVAPVSATAKELPPGRTRHRRPTSPFTQCFGITEAEVVRIEREGSDNNWPPR